MKRISVLIADATRARFYSYEQVEDVEGLRDELREQRDLVDPARHQRTSDGQTHELDSHFAKQIATTAEQLTSAQAHHELIVVASSRMLGPLRASLAQLKRTVAITELERDFTKLTIAELRDHLATLGLLPARPRLHTANP